LCVTRSCDWDISRILLRKNFYRLPFTPPSLVRRFDPSMVQAKERERRREWMHLVKKRSTGGAFYSCHGSRCSCLVLLLLHVVACPGAAPSHASGRSNECHWHLLHAWAMRTQNYSGGQLTSRKWHGRCVREVMALIFDCFPSQK
jgi:hypothetical protein